MASLILRPALASALDQTQRMICKLPGAAHHACAADTASPGRPDASALCVLCTVHLPLIAPSDGFIAWTSASGRPRAQAKLSSPWPLIL